MNEDRLRYRSNNNNNDPVIDIKNDDGNKNPREVQVSAIFKKMGEIDTAKECFTAEVDIHAKWREPSLDGASEEVVKQIDFGKLWNPKLCVSNMLTEQKDVTSYNVTFLGDHLAYIFCQKSLKGCFMENLELQMFPFDLQDLTVTLTSELTSAEVRLVADSNESKVNTDLFVDEQEWKLRSNVRREFEQTQKLDIGEQSFGHSHPLLKFKCTVERRYQFFLWNFAFILGFICFMCLTTFSVNCTLPQNRLQLTFILLLTTVALKSNINNLLPKISYLTMMDKYFLGCWVIQCSMCIWHAVVGCLLLKHPNVVEIDWGILGLFFLIIFVFQIFCVLYSFKKLKMKRELFGKTETSEPRQNRSDGADRQGEKSLLRYNN